jgi:hypothetical protein
MSKRFHDTEIWKQDWFLELPYEYMLLWLYIKDTCDHAGIWKPNKRFIEFISGKTIDLKKAIEFFNGNKGRIEILSNGRWLIPDFISFQYGHKLNPENRVHSSILAVLEKNEVNLTSIRGLLEVKDRVKDKDKDKDSIIYKGVVRGEIPTFDFDAVWLKYPNRVGKKEAERHFRASVKTEEDYILINRAVKNYCGSEKVEKGFIQNGSTWFNNWRDWIDLPQKPKVRII